MIFHLESAEIFIPDNLPIEKALARTTHLCVAAHQDDVEIMAAQPILECYQREDQWFTAVIMTDGRGSPRAGVYSKYSDEEMRQVRFREQRKAAIVGEYGALIMLDFPSSVIKNGKDKAPVDDLAVIFEMTHPRLLYTHNLADKHDSHVAVALRVISAARRLSTINRPQSLYGCEVWRSLDWMNDADKISMQLSQQENLQAALLGVFDSQISGGKRYDLASLARRRANATYFESHAVDQATSLSFAMDMTPLLLDDHKTPETLVMEHIHRFTEDITSRLIRLNEYDHSTSSPGL